MTRLLQCIGSRSRSRSIQSPGRPPWWPLCPSPGSQPRRAPSSASCLSRGLPGQGCWTSWPPPHTRWCSTSRRIASERPFRTCCTIAGTQQGAQVRSTLACVAGASSCVGSSRSCMKSSYGGPWWRWQRLCRYLLLLLLRRRKSLLRKSRRKLAYWCVSFTVFCRSSTTTTVSVMFAAMHACQLSSASHWISA